MHSGISQHIRSRHGHQKQRQGGHCDELRHPAKKRTYCKYKYVPLTYVRRATPLLSVRFPTQRRYSEIAEKPPLQLAMLSSRLDTDV